MVRSANHSQPGHGSKDRCGSFSAGRRHRSLLRAAAFHQQGPATAHPPAPARMRTRKPFPLQQLRKTPLPPVNGRWGCRGAALPVSRPLGRCLPDTPLSPFVHPSCQRRPNDQHLPVTAQPERAPNSRLFQGLRHTTAVAGCLSAGDTLLSLPGSRNRGAVPADQPPGSSAIEPEVRAKRSALFQSESEARTNLKTAFPLHLSLVDEPAGELAASRSTVDASSTDCRQLEDEHLPR